MGIFDDEEIEADSDLINIIVNGFKIKVYPQEMSYERLVVIDGYNSSRILSVTYRSKSKDGWVKEGSLIPGQSVQLEDGMIFNIADTSNA